MQDVDLVPGDTYSEMFEKNVNKRMTGVRKIAMDKHFSVWVLNEKTNCPGAFPASLYV